MFAHRGGAGLFPENTIYAFKQAIEKYKVDALEIDVHLTKDGEPIVIHDDTLERTTNGKGHVSETTLKEIKKLDAGYNFTPDGGKTFPYRGKGITVPTLKEVLLEFQSSQVGINIEIKLGYKNIENKIYNMIVGLNMMDYCLVNSGYYTVMERFRKINKRGIPVGADTFSGAKAYFSSKLNLKPLFKVKADALQLPYKYKNKIPLITENLVKLCKSSGVKLHIWTIDDKDLMRKLLDLGVDGIMSDYPDRLHAVYKEYGYV